VISKEQIENDLEEVCECGDAKDSHVGGTGECNICRWNNPIPDSLPCKEFRPVSQS
jgi:hypothetical protein